MPVRVFVTAGPIADCTQASKLIASFKADYLLADKGYDSGDLISQAIAQGMKIVIPPKKNRLLQRDFDKDLYQARHQVENAFYKLKQWRGVSTRYAKTTSSFLAIIQIRCIAMWGEII